MEEITRLSDVKPARAFFLKEEDLNRYVFNTKRIDIDIYQNYDVALVLGCSIYDIMEKRADAAIMLYYHKLVEKLFLTGGVGFLSKNRNDSEANVMKRYLLEKGVKEKDIIVEDKSRDTYENMKNSVGTIKKEVGSKGSIVMVTSDFHLKRAKGLLSKMSDLDIYSYGVLDGKHDIDKWNHGNLSAKRLLRTEALMLSMYVQNQKIYDAKVTDVSRVR